MAMGRDGLIEAVSLRAAHMAATNDVPVSDDDPFVALARHLLTQCAGYRMSAATWEQDVEYVTRMLVATMLEGRQR